MNKLRTDLEKSDGLFRKFIEEKIRFIRDNGVEEEFSEEIVTLCSLLEMAFKVGRPRQLRMKSISGKPQWVLSVEDKFKDQK